MGLRRRGISPGRSDAGPRFKRFCYFAFNRAGWINIEGEFIESQHSQEYRKGPLQFFWNRDLWQCIVIQWTPPKIPVSRSPLFLVRHSLSLPHKLTLHCALGGGIVTGKDTALGLKVN